MLLERYRGIQAPGAPPLGYGPPERSTSEPAVPESHTQRGRLYRWPARAERPAAAAILHGLARRAAPQTQPPRKAVGRQKKGPAGTGSPAGPEKRGLRRVARLGHPRASTLQISHASGFCTKKAPTEAGASCHRVSQTVGGAAFRPGRYTWPFGRRPPGRGGNDGPRRRCMGGGRLSLFTGPPRPEIATQRPPMRPGKAA